MNSSLLVERQKQLSEIVLAALSADPTKVVHIGFLEKVDFHDAYKDIFSSVSRIGSVDGELFEKIYTKGKESLKDLMLEYRDISVEQLVAIAKTLSGISRRLELLKTMSHVSENAASMTRDEILDSVNNMSKLFARETSSSGTGEDVKMLTQGESISSGYQELDSYTHGFNRGQLWLLAARPSIGKSAFALNMTTRMLFSGKSVAFNTLEMPPAHLILRMASLIAGTPMDKTINLSLGDEERCRLGVALASLAKVSKRFFPIEERNPLKFASIIERFRPQMVFVDYLQLMSGRGDSPNERVGYISSTLKEISSMAPVCALSQLNRSIEKREDPRPMLADLRDSGSLEQDADLVLFLDRPGRRGITQENASILSLDIAKQRNGATGTIILRALMPYGLIV